MLMQQPEMPDKLKLQIISATEVLGAAVCPLPVGDASSREYAFVELSQAHSKYFPTLYCRESIRRELKTHLRILAPRLNQ